MDEHDDVSSSLATSVSESTVAITVPIGDEILTEHASFQGQVEGPFGDGDGGDIMVEVVGSDLYVDGVGGHGSGGEFNGKLDGGGGDGLGKDGLGRELEAFDGGDVVMSEVVTREVGDLCGEAWDARTESVVEGFEQRPGLSAEQAHDVTKGVEVMTGSASERAQVDVTEKIEVKFSEEGKHGGLVEGVMQNGVDSVDRVSSDSMPQRVELLDDGVCNPGIKAVLSSPAMAESSSLEILIGTEEVTVSGKEKALICKDEDLGGDDVKMCLPSSSMERISDVKMVIVRTDKNSAALENPEFPDQHADATIGREVELINKENILYSKVENTEFDASAHSLPCSLDKEKALICKDEVLGGDDVKMCLPSSSIEQSSDVKMVNVRTDKNSAALENPEFPDQQADVTIGREAELINKENILYSKVENTESDVSHQSLPCALDNQKMKVESSTESSVNGLFNTDLPSLLEPNIAAAADGEVDAVYAKVSSNLVVGIPQTILEGISDGAGEVVILCADSVSSVMETQVATGQSAASDCKISALNHGTQDSGGGEVLTSESGVVSAFDRKLDYIDPALGVDTTIVRSKIASVECEPDSDGQRTEVVNVNDVAEMYNKLTVPEAKVSSTINKDGIVACSAGFQSHMTTVHDGKYGALHSGQESLCEEACIAERGELAVLGADEALDCKNETPEIASVDSLNHSQKDQNTTSLKIDESSEHDVALGHPEISGEQTQIPCGGHTAEMDKFEDINEDLKAATVLTCKENEGENITMVGEITEKDSNAQVNAAASEEQTNTEIEVDSAVIKSQGTAEVTACDALNPNVILSAQDDDLKVESAWINTDVDHVVGEGLFLGAVAGDHGSSIPPEISNNLGGHTAFQNETQEAVEQAEALSHEVGQDKSEHRQIVDGMSNDAFEEVLEVTGSQLAPTCVSSRSDHEPGSSTNAITNHFLDGNQYSEVNDVSNDASLPVEDGTAFTYVSDPVTFSEVVNQGIAAQGGTSDTDVPVITYSGGPGENISNVEDELEVDKQYTDHLEDDSSGEQDVGNEEYTESEPSNGTDHIVVKPESSVRILQSSYLLPPENEGEFSVSDLVWGKVRSHPWWPGQIFDPADASEKAVKYLKKDSFLVAYFGDRTFAWNDASLLKPFRSHFSQVEKQSNSEAFQNAVSCALEEVSRRVELGLACCCLPEGEYEKIESQIVENTGIREESSRRCGVDKSTGVNSFQPDKLVEYITALAQFPTGGSERLELVIAKAQLLAFCHFKGYRQPPEFQFCGGLAETDAHSELNEAAEHATPVLNDGGEILSGEGNSVSENDSSHKRKHNLNDSMYPRKKERTLTELMGDTAHSPDSEDESDRKIMNKLVSSSSGKKRKAVDSIMDGSDKRKSINAAKVSAAASFSPKPFFKVGECIRRVASQLTGSPLLIKCSTDQPGLDSLAQTPENYQGGTIVPMDVSPDDMLSQLHLAARDPLKGYSFFSIIISFFSGFRDSVVLCQSRQTSSRGRLGGGRKKKASQAVTGSAEEFEFEDFNDSYWTDRMIHNYPEEQLLPCGESGEERQLVAFDPDKSGKSSRRSRKRYSNANQEMVEKELTEQIDERKQDLPVELVLNFAEGNSFPSEMNLNKIFRRFGPLKDYETEVDRETGRARVVFKRGSDAEVAFSSAGKFNIFGPMHVNYQLNYSPSIAYKPLPLEILQGQEDAI